MKDSKIIQLASAREPADPVDGRRMRSERSRELIISAMLSLVREGDMNPSAASVAERAGVGLRSVFRHFEDMDTLYQEIAGHIERIVLPKIVAPFQSRHWRGRLEELVKRRAAIYEEIMPYRVVAHLRRFVSAYLMDSYRRSMLLERAALKSVLPEAIHGDKILFAALEMTTGFQTWRRLRQDQGLGPAEAEAVMALMAMQLVQGK